VVPAAGAYRRRGVAALGVPHSLDPHHDADGHGLVLHDEASHSIASHGGSPQDDAVHCLSCHTARSFRFGSVSIDVARPVLNPAPDTRSYEAPASAGQASVQPPLRAPPASPALV
jgi:hypothetical protein